MHSLLFNDPYFVCQMALTTQVKNMINIFLTLMWVGFLGVVFEVGRGGRGNYPLRLKLVRVKLETSNLGRKCTPIFSFRKYIF